MSTGIHFTVGSQEWTFRPAKPGDASVVVPWIYEATREIQDYLFASRPPFDFLRREFISPRGYGSHACFEVFEHRGAVSGAAAFYPASGLRRLRWGTWINLSLFLPPWTALGILLRRPRISRLFSSFDEPRGLLLGIFAVAPEKRRGGVATAYLRKKLKMAKDLGHTHVFLDAFDANTAAVNLYTKLGFRVHSRAPLVEGFPSSTTYLLTL